jgi:hypothetical protein
MPELRESIHPTGPGHFGYAARGIAALVNPDRLRRILTRMLDETNSLARMGSEHSPAITLTTPTSSKCRVRNTE